MEPIGNRSGVPAEACDASAVDVIPAMVATVIALRRTLVNFAVLVLVLVDLVIAVLLVQWVCTHFRIVRFMSPSSSLQSVPFSRSNEWESTTLTPRYDPVMKLDKKQLALIAFSLVAVLASACGGGSDTDAGSDTAASSEMVTLELDVTSSDQSELDSLVKVVEQRLAGLGLDGAEVLRSGSSVEVKVRATDEPTVRSLVASKAVSLEFRPVLSNLGRALPEGGRPKAEEEAAALRTELGIPNGVTAEQVVERAVSEELSGVADPVIGTNGVAIDYSDNRFVDLYYLELQLGITLTPAELVVPDKPATLSSDDGMVSELGPAAVTGDAIEDATASEGPGEWSVDLLFRKGPSGIDLFNKLAAKCFAGEPECPAQQEHGSLAVVLDGVVMSAPTINEASFERDQIVISGSFTENEAKDLALSLRYGSGPVIKFKN